jgi:hypothetical protein
MKSKIYYHDGDRTPYLHRTNAPMTINDREYMECSKEDHANWLSVQDKPSNINEYTLINNGQVREGDVISCGDEYIFVPKFLIGRDVNSLKYNYIKRISNQ